MNRLTAQWVRKAEADWAAAGKLADAGAQFRDTVCFHSQHCAEKYLKALLQAHNIAPPRTHNLLHLLASFAQSAAVS